MHSNRPTSLLAAGSVTDRSLLFARPPVLSVARVREKLVFGSAFHISCHSRGAERNNSNVYRNVKAAYGLPGLIM